mmetsp:Transcript_14429/g.14468  ORF Transcript_14429/g.14468 Transcript_14429/m.14468 type:complete len:471 (+) Transcript_14429:1-1413(+)|eukprot:CAMPEP_0202946114 /NCGR_PEP_ID=MMETSP1395-20130829/8556_1 /ASSEMBLY_ACC=CAM_ASM_000871 /TAXON_ID=5961 /ORGANISM="Blepharisma japonicum, Strain Stock R1072" /LENGTH=470 /DNA_ID=CAMNT_0049646515 /DNA_START=1 /DNA_END=1413 /DNA_ORIENTATION=+
MGSKLHFLILLLGVFAEIAELDGVWSLEDKTFPAALEIQPTILVEFYEPGCELCIQLAPELVKAARELKALDPPFRIAVMDSLTNPGVAQEYKITEFPSFIFFVNKRPTKYTGGGNAASIVSWVKKRIGFAMTKINTLEKLKSEIENNKLSVILWTLPNSTDLGVYEHIAKTIDGPAFLVSTDPEALTHYGMEEKQMSLFNPDDGRVDYKGGFNTFEMTKFIENYKKPAIIPFNNFALEFIFKGKNSVVFFFRADEDAEKYEETLKTLAKEYRSDLTFVTTDLKKKDNEVLSDFLGIYPESQPAILIFHPVEGMLKFLLEEPFSLEATRKLINKFKKRETVPFYKSQPIPEEPYENGVRVLVGKNFEEVVYNSGKNVLVEFYAPWCEHCKEFTPEYEKLAVYLKNKENIIIAKMDAIKNEAKDIEIQSYPTLKFFVAGQRTPLDYTGERSANGLIEFLLQGPTEKTRTDL